MKLDAFVGFHVARGVLLALMWGERARLASADAWSLMGCTSPDALVDFLQRSLAPRRSTPGRKLTSRHVREVLWLRRTM